MKPDAVIFRAYDIRGTYPEQLSEPAVHAIGQAFGSMVIDAGQQLVITGRDARLSGPALSQTLIDGIQSSGCDVIDIGVVPTPVLYFASYQLGHGTGVMLTGSHNPGNYNGLKMLIDGESLAEQKIQDIYQRIAQHDFHQGQGSVKNHDIIEAYSQAVIERTKHTQQMTVVVDAGNGVAGMLVPTLLKRLGYDVIELFCEPDGAFPNHHPDPSKPENLTDLIAAVQTQQADIGLAFDGDGDRLGVVSPQGEIIWPDRQMMLYAEDVLHKKAGAEILFDVKCSKNLAGIIEKNGGKATMCQTGHALIKKKLKQTGAALAGEMSGHIFFADHWFGFDDALYTAVRLLEILGQKNQSVDAVFSGYPNSANTPEINVTVADDQKFILIEKLVANAHFDQAKVITIDGLRVEFTNGWALIRASNTTPCVVLRFEADSQQDLEQVQDRFYDYLQQQAAEITWR